MSSSSSSSSPSFVGVTTVNRIICGCFAEAGDLCTNASLKLNEIIRFNCTELCCVVIFSICSKGVLTTVLRHSAGVRVNIHSTQHIVGTECTQALAYIATQVGSDGGAQIKGNDPNTRIEWVRCLGSQVLGSGVENARTSRFA